MSGNFVAVQSFCHVLSQFAVASLYSYFDLGYHQSQTSYYRPSIPLFSSVRQNVCDCHVCSFPTQISLLLSLQFSTVTRARLPKMGRVPFGPLGPRKRGTFPPQVLQPESRTAHKIKTNQFRCTDPGPWFDGTYHCRRKGQLAGSCRSSCIQLS